MQDIIISIRHAFAEKIYSGEKTYELRKRRPNIHVGTRCWIYEPLPIGRVTGYFTYRGCYRDTKEAVFNAIGDQLGISHETYMQYYDREYFAHAWKIADPKKVESFMLQDVGISRAPQSYMIWGVSDMVGEP